MKFTPSEAIEIPVKNGNIYQNEIENSDWWDQFNTKIKSGNGREKILSFKDGLGCYIFSIKWYGKILPWYVGKTEKQTFAKECFHPHKFSKYSKVFTDKNGIPMLTLIAKIKEKQLGLSKQPSGIAELEEMLIRVCAIQNRDLSNIITAATVKKLQVEGFTVPTFKSKRGRRETRVVDFSKLIGKK